MKSFTPLILIAICVGAYFVYIQPTYGNIQTLVTQKNDYTNVLEKSKELASERDAVLAQYNAVSPDDIASLKKIVPDQFDSVALAKHLSAIASNYGMIVKDVEITEATAGTDQEVVSPQKDQYHTTYGSFTVNGTYDQFVKFLKDLESGLYLIDVTNLSIKGNIINPQLSSYEYTVGFQTYSLN